MSGEEDNGVVHTQKEMQEPRKAPGRSFPRAWAVTIILGILIAAAALLPGILSGDKESPEVALENGVEATGEATAITPTAPPEEPKALSPQALEDLSPAPTGDLAINPEPLLLEPVPEENEEATGEEAPAVAGPGPETPEEETPAPTEEPFSVGEALARYLLAIRNDLNSEYVANCIRFRNRNGAGAGCPKDPAFSSGNYQREQALVDELFAVITRKDDNARISSQLVSENETLATVLDDPDNPAALQARTKLDLNNGYLSYLNGNPNPAVTAFNTMNDFINDYNRTILVGPTQFRCKGGPCVYK